MNHDKFNLLPISEQASYTWRNDIYLASRIDGNLPVNLYWLEDFFVEIFYDPKKNCIGKVRSFKNSNCIDAYLGYIDLDTN